jgi:hypothetical protein
LTLEHFAWVDDEGALHDPRPCSPILVPDLGCLVYGCGIFRFRRQGQLMQDGGAPSALLQ